MNREGLFFWIAFMAAGFLFGGVMFSQWLPQLIAKKDICADSADHNPGATNVFMACGVPLGMTCLLLDVFKGFLPVFLAAKVMNIQQMWFAAVIAMPVLGHAIAPFNRFRGGKCIATAFGTLLALLPLTRIVLVLAAVYIFFSVVIPIRPNRRRSIVAFGLLGMTAAAALLLTGRYSVYAGCIFVAGIVVLRHTKRFCFVPADVETAGV